jgi:hypothetical protein
LVRCCSGTGLDFVPFDDGLLWIGVSLAKAGSEEFG